MGDDVGRAIEFDEGDAVPSEFLRRWVGFVGVRGGCFFNAGGGSEDLIDGFVAPDTDIPSLWSDVQPET
jgi:hypothetical protein